MVKLFLFVISDQTTIFPPSPTPKELVSIKVSFSTVVYVACKIPFEPCQSPPTKIFPPPVSPVASNFEFDLICISLPVISISPPFVFELASMVPATSVPPNGPADKFTFLAFIDPLLETNLITPFSEIKLSADLGALIVCSMSSCAALA